MQTALTAHTKTIALRDLSAAAVVLTGAFAYLGVGWRHSTLLSLVLVLQAGLGTYLLQRLVDGPAWTLFFFMGPGLIVGGAVSLAIFQLAGRGQFGVVASLLAGILGTVALTQRRVDESNRESQLLMWLNLLGAAAFILSSEFEWLIAPALILYASNLVLVRTHDQHGRHEAVVIACLAILLVTSMRLRTSWWWLISDDYKMFEVIGQHVTHSGPFKPWGSISFASYHWLSYGWSGLLSYTSGSTASLVTLTRVMPFVFSVALASSILFFASKMQRNRAVSWGAVTAVWAVLAVTRLDWSGTSTAGVFAVLATFLAIVTVILQSDLAMWRRLVVYALFALITVLTKFPSVLMFPSLLLAVETTLYRRKNNRSGMLAPTLAAIAGCIMAIAAVPILGAIVGEFHVATPNPLLGELATRGVFFALAGVLIRSVWLLVALLVPWMAQGRLRSATGDVLDCFCLSLLPLFFLGVVFDVLVTGDANAYQYFSVPSYFLASMGLLVFIPMLTEVTRGSPRTRGLSLLVLTITILLALQLFVRVLDAASWTPYSTVVEVVRDYRLHLGIMMMVMIKRHALAANFASIIVLSLVLPTLRVVDSTTTQLIQMQNERPATRSEIDVYLGSSDEEAVGLWIRENTDEGTLIATNSLPKDKFGSEFDGDFALAMWSRREFLVLGPGFGNAIESAENEIDLCLRFGHEPTTKDREALIDRGVEWFVVDLALTTHREWEDYGEVVLKTDSLWVLRISDSVAS